MSKAIACQTTWGRAPQKVIPDEQKSMINRTSFMADRKLGRYIETFVEFAANGLGAAPQGQGASYLSM